MHEHSRMMASMVAGMLDERACQCDGIHFGASLLTKTLARTEPPSASPWLASPAALQVASCAGQLCRRVRATVYHGPSEGMQIPAPLKSTHCKDFGQRAFNEVESMPATHRKCSIVPSIWVDKGFVEPSNSS